METPVERVNRLMAQVYPEAERPFVEAHSLHEEEFALAANGYVAANGYDTDELVCLLVLRHGDMAALCGIEKPFTDLTDNELLRTLRNISRILVEKIYRWLFPEAKFCPSVEDMMAQINAVKSS